MSSAPRSPLRQLLENRISQLSSEVEGLFADARDRSRREFADQLNQVVRRIRQSEDIEALSATLVDATRSFATGAALFEVDGAVAKGRRIRGIPEDPADAFRSFAIPLNTAAALAGAVDTRDPVIAVTTPGEVSPELMELAEHGADGRVAIFPLVVRDRVAALIYAWGTVQGSAMELLAQVASGVWSDLSRPAPVPLLQIAPAPVAPPQYEAVPADSKPGPEAVKPGADDEKVHLQAQRFARVQVAEMRLYQADAVQAGRSRGSLYHALREPIDTARERFRESYVSTCASMVDYFHLELVRTLANDDPEILGKDYPGPLL